MTLQAIDDPCEKGEHCKTCSARTRPTRCCICDKELI